MMTRWNSRMAVLVTLLSTAPLAAQSADTTRRGTPHDFDFLEGKWNVVYNNSQPGIPPNVRGVWTAEKQADGRVLADEFRLMDNEGRTAALGMTYRAFDHVRQQWDMRYVALVITGPDGSVRLPAQWAEITAWRDGNTMRVDQRGGGRRLRITYYDISPKHFSWKADVSTDDGATWRQNQIRIEATRAP